jgi:hypothetical protein
MITVWGNDRVLVETKTLIADYRGGKLIRVVGRKNGKVFINDENADKRAPLQLVFPGNTRLDLDPGCRNGDTEITRFSDLRADVRFNTWNGVGILSISEDPQTGDLLIEPSGFSARPGLRSVRWDAAGFREDAEMIAPLFQGVKVGLNDPMIRGSRFIYPYKWESNFVAFHSGKDGIWIRSEEDPYRFRTLNVGDGADWNRIGLETETCGPITENLSAGGCVWRINVYEGDWTTPVKEYKAKLWERLELEKRRDGRPEWADGIRLAYSWCPTDRAILTELKRYIAPAKVLIHLPHWRKQGYDMGYPDYTPSAEASAFIEEATEMGYHVAPHFNAYEIDPTQKEFEWVRDFRYREIETKAAMGWAFDGGCVPVPENNMLLCSSQHHNVMTKIHPGHAMWRYLLTKSIAEAVAEVRTDTVFLDVTHNVFNLDNERVNDMTCGEGVVRLLRDVEKLHRGLTVGGEGLNEVVASGQYFAQGHIFAPINGAPPETVTPEKMCPVNRILYDGVCSLIGYHPHVGDAEQMKRTFELDDARGFIPTLIGIGADALREPDEVIRSILDRALSD